MDSGPGTAPEWMACITRRTTAMMFSAEYDTLARLIQDGEIGAALELLGELDSEAEDDAIRDIKDLIRQMLELLIHRGLDGDPAYSEFDNDNASVNNYMRDGEIGILVGTIAGCNWDRPDRPLLDDVELDRAISDEWSSALQTVIWHIPGMPLERLDLEAKLDKDRILKRALELILAEKHLDERARED
jgi:hypothetical protein